MDKLVSIITLNFNNTDITADFILSLERLTYKNFEIIVVDNNSTRDPSEQLLKLNPGIKIIRCNKNLGFTGGNNVGIKVARGDFLFIVNNDTEIADSNLLEKLIEPFGMDNRIGMVSPKIRYYSNKEIIQFAGYDKVNPFTGRSRQIGRGQTDQGQFDIPGYTNYAHGAAMMVKREVVEKAGVFPDHFFIYYEELDWSSQARKNGYKIYYQAGAFIYHKESMTMGKISAIKTYFMNKNRILFMRRNSGYFQFLIFLFYFTFLTVPKNLLVFALHKQWDHIQSFLNAILWPVKNFRIFWNEPIITTIDSVKLEESVN